MLNHFARHFSVIFFSSPNLTFLYLAIEMLGRRRERKSVVFKGNMYFIITICKQHLMLHSDLNFLLPEMLKNFLSYWVKWRKALRYGSFGLYPFKSLKLLTSACLTTPRSLCLSRSVHFSLQNILHSLTASGFPGVRIVQACSLPSAPYL